MKLFPTKLPRLTPKWRLQLQMLLGGLLGLAATWRLTDVLDTPLSRMPFWPRVGLWAAFGMLGYVSMLKRRTPDKTALKPDWWK